MNNDNDGILKDFRQPKQRDKYFKVRNILNLIFIILVIVTIAVYFLFPLPDGLPVFFSVCLITIFVKAVEVYLRISAKRKEQ